MWFKTICYKQRKSGDQFTSAWGCQSISSCTRDVRTQCSYKCWLSWSEKLSRHRSCSSFLVLLRITLGQAGSFCLFPSRNEWVTIKRAFLYINWKIIDSSKISIDLIEKISLNSHNHYICGLLLICININVDYY